MNQNPVLHVESERMRALGEAVARARQAEPWQADHGRALLALDTDALVRMALEGPDILSAAWQFSLKRVTSSPNADYEAGWQAVDALLRAGLHGIRGALELSRLMATWGYAIDGMEELEKAI